MKYQLFYLLFILTASISFFDQSSYVNSRYYSSTSINKNKLKHEILKRIERVDELRAMKKFAAELGIEHVYLFGGSAAAWAHYVYWDLEREIGLGNYDDSRFDYDYSSIFRANQDMDIVIDVDASNKDLVSQFEKLMQKRFPHFQGNRPAWEVRPLRFEYGGKEKILNNPDFLAQNSDSHSTGLIAITNNDEIGIRDFKDWNNRHNKFLDDVFNRKLHYYRNQLKHQTTKRFKAGLNPEIFSAIRYLTKAFQYELTMDRESLAHLREVLLLFDVNRDLKENYTRKWVEKNGKKLYQNAIDLEFAYKTMKELNVLEKLNEIENNSSVLYSLSWWMNKQPLLSFPLGDSITGKTAKELEIDIVAHETRSFAAYESITKSHSGRANVFISRENVKGESAAYGSGFYTRIGKQGAIGSGLTIRFKLNPEAIEGVDFIRNDNFVIVKNKTALKVIPESLQISPLDYFRKLAAGELLFDHSDRGVVEKVKRKIGLKLNNISENDRDEILKMVEMEINSRMLPSLSEGILREWFSMKISAAYPEFLEKLIERGVVDTEITQFILSEPHWNANPKWVQAIIKRGVVDRNIVNFVLSEEHWSKYPELVLQVAENSQIHKLIVTEILTKPYWREHPEIVEFLIKNGDVDYDIIKFLFSDPYWSKYPKLLEQVIDNGSNIHFIVETVLDNKGWEKHPKLVEKIIKMSKFDPYIISGVLVHQSWAKHSYLIDLLLEKGNLDSALSLHILSKDYWSYKSEWVETILERGKVDRALVKYVLSQEHWKERSDWVEKIFFRGEQHAEMIEHIFSKPFGIKYMHLVDQLIDRGDYDHKIIQHILRNDEWSEYPSLVKKIIEKGTLDTFIATTILPYPHWENSPELVELLIENGNANHQIELHLFTEKHWKNHPYFLKKLKGKELNLKNMKEYLAREKAEYLRCSELLGEMF